MYICTYKYRGLGDLGVQGLGFRGLSNKNNQRFRGILYHNYNKEPQNNIGNDLGPYSNSSSWGLCSPAYRLRRQVRMSGEDGMHISQLLQGPK